MTFQPSTIQNLRNLNLGHEFDSLAELDQGHPHNTANVVVQRQGSVESTNGFQTAGDT